MTITKLTKHNDHKIKLHLTRPGTIHYAALRCCECNKHIQWLNKLETQLLMQSGVDFKTKGIVSNDTFAI